MALRLHNLFFLNFTVIFFTTFLLSGIISYYTLKEIELRYFERQLVKFVNLAELQLKHVDDLDSFVKEFFETTEIHFTIIDTGGYVLASTSETKGVKRGFLDAFPELKGTKEGKIGSAVRYDTTLLKEFIYVAKSTTYKNENIFLKLSFETKDVMEDTYSLWVRLLFVFVISLFTGLFVAHTMNKSISNEIEKITHFLSEIAEKRYQAKLQPSFTKEFIAISEMLKGLARRLEKRDKKLKKQTAMLRLKNRQNSEIISAIGHEFKNPVAIIVGYSETLCNDKNLNESIKMRFLGKIASNAKKISNLIDRLTIFAKLENNTLEVKKSVFNIYEVCKDVKNMLEERYKGRDVEIHGQTRIIEADRSLIDLVLVNLVDNALKYSEDSVTINITSNSVEVIDRGIGIAKEDIELVTKKFYRVDENRWNNSLGLGLSIVKYILRLHDSDLHIESIQNEGSKFSFEI